MISLYIIAHLTANVSATSTELAEVLDLKPPRIRELLAELQQEDIVVSEGTYRNRTYKLKT